MTEANKDRPVGTDSGTNMPSKNKILKDFESAREAFDGFELMYRLLKPEDLTYLREHSIRYKQAVIALQEIILPAVRAICPTCTYGTCCRLSAPEIKIYIAGSVGCFDVKDFLLARCDADFPPPDLENVGKNLCPFNDNGCRLNADSRSLTCLEYFCEPLRRALDMKFVSRCLADVRAVVKAFSLRRLLESRSKY